MIFNKLFSIPLLAPLLPYAQLMRLDRPVGTLLLLWPTLWALWIASEGSPDSLVLFVFVSGVFLMRSAGCVANDYADRDFDGHVARTRERPLPAGRIKPRQALLLLAGLCLLAFLLVLLMNNLTIMLSFVGIVLAITYPFSKRYTYLPQFHLGLAFGWGIPMAFAAQTNEVTDIAWLLLIANVLWSVAYDTMYAMVDREDDLKIGVKSTAILFADMDRLIIGCIQILMLICMLFIGEKLELGLYYYASLGVAAALFAYQQYLIRERDKAGCFTAFLNNNWAGMAIFIGLLLHYSVGTTAL